MTPPPPDTGPRRSVANGFAFLLGGLAMIFIGWVWGRDSALDGVYAGALLVVGVVGAVAGAALLVQLLWRRG
jgi:hypothetical protein